MEVILSSGDNVDASVGLAKEAVVRVDSHEPVESKIRDDQRMESVVGC